MSEYDEQLSTIVEIDGKKYDFELTDFHARKLKKLGFNVYEFFSDEQTLVAFWERSELFTDVIAFFCELSEPDDSFYKALTGDKLDECRKAVKNAIVNFSPQVGRENVLKQFAEMVELATVSELELESQSTE